MTEIEGNSDKPWALSMNLGSFSPCEDNRGSCSLTSFTKRPYQAQTQPPSNVKSCFLVVEKQNVGNCKTHYHEVNIILSSLSQGTCLLSPYHNIIRKTIWDQNSIFHLVQALPKRSFWVTLKRVSKWNNVSCHDWKNWVCLKSKSISIDRNCKSYFKREQGILAYS